MCGSNSFIHKNLHLLWARSLSSLQEEWTKGVYKNFCLNGHYKEGRTLANPLNKMNNSSFKLNLLTLLYSYLHLLAQFHETSHFKLSLDLITIIITFPLRRVVVFLACLWLYCNGQMRLWNNVLTNLLLVTAGGFEIILYEITYKWVFR